MDYENVKLGLIEKIKVWRLRREAEKIRNIQDHIEGEISEVDYSEADRLEADLLEKKRIKKATRDARRVFKHCNNIEKYGYDVLDGISEEKFIEKYLVEHGVEKKRLTSPEIPETKHDFIKKYSIEKSEEERSYEKANDEPKIYYKVDGKEYELPSTFDIQFKSMKERGIEIPLKKLEDGKYLIMDNEMEPKSKWEMLDAIAWTVAIPISFYIDESTSPTKDEKIMEQARKAYSLMNFDRRLAKKMSLNGEVDKANEILNKLIKKMIKAKEEIEPSENEEER